MVTSQMKDVILSELANAPLETLVEFDPKEFEDISFNNLNAILCQFERMGFISSLNARRVHIGLVIHVEAVDYYSCGGFTAQEELLKNNIKKLNLELETLSKNLSPQFAEHAAKITGIISNISAALALFK